MSEQNPDLLLTVDLTNPGQFFACCGLLELADRVGQNVTAWFDHDVFHVVSAPKDLLAIAATVDLEQMDPGNDTSSAIRLGLPFDLTLDWWNDTVGGGKGLKVWAGSMRNVRIASAMQAAMQPAVHADPSHIFDHGLVVYGPDDKKVEPFYFDSRRGDSADAVDVGFSPDKQNLTTTAHPAVEFLCLIGLQRFRPDPTSKRRIYQYTAWSEPLSVELASAACAGRLPAFSGRRFRFENAYRTDQKKHKAFVPAIPLGDPDDFA